METRKTLSNSVQGEIDAAQAEDYILPLPQGVNLCTEEELILWVQYTGARAPDAWRELELLMVGRLVKIEMHLRELEALIEEEGYFVTNQRGTQIANPSVAVQASYQRQQLSILSSLSLGVSSEKAVTLNGTGKKAKKKEDDTTNKKKAKVSLLAV